MDAGNAQAACRRGLLRTPKPATREAGVGSGEMGCKKNSRKPTTKWGSLIGFELSGVGQQLTGRTLGAGQGCCCLAKVHDTSTRSLVVGLGMKPSHQNYSQAIFSLTALACNEIYSLASTSSYFQVVHIQLYCLSNIVIILISTSTYMLHRPLLDAL